MIVCLHCIKPPVRDGRMWAKCPCGCLVLQLYEKNCPDFGLWLFTSPRDAPDPCWISIKVGRSGRQVRMTRPNRHGHPTDETVPWDVAETLVEDFFHNVAVSAVLQS